MTDAEIIEASNCARDRVRAADAARLAAQRRWRDRSPEQQAAEEAEWQAAGDAEHAVWLASGEVDEFPRLLSEWQARRKTERAAAESEWDALLARMFAASGDDDLTEEQEAELNGAIDEWQWRYRHIFPAAKINVDSQESEMHGAPGHSNALSLFDGDPATAWVSRDRFNNPAAGDWANAAVLLRRLKIEVRYNAWTERTEIREAGEAWTERQDWHMDKLARVGSSDPHNYRPSESVLRRAVDSLARVNTIDPARELLNQLEREYDGVPRLSTWLSHACGVPADPYHQAAGVAILGGLVSRIRVPGIKFDLMPVFISEQQGTSKSTLARLLALDNDWFIEDVALGEASKELVLLLAGKSIVEISEMKTRGEVAAVKAMVSRTHDEGRPAYGRSPVKRPRRHIFVGTTNEREFLEDISGGRRFLPIVVRGEIDLAWVRANLPQLVGEAATLQSRGREIGLPREVWALAGEHQEAARVTSATEELLRDWYETPESEVYVCAAKIVKRLADERQSASHKAVAAIMRRLGYVPDRTREARLWVKSSTGRYHAGCQEIGIWKMLPPPPPPKAG